MTLQMRACERRRNASGAAEAAGGGRICKRRARGWLAAGPAAGACGLGIASSVWLFGPAGPPNARTQQMFKHAKRSERRPRRRGWGPRRAMRHGAACCLVCTPRACGRVRGRERAWPGSSVRQRVVKKAWGAALARKATLGLVRGVLVWTGVRRRACKSGCRTPASPPRRWMGRARAAVRFGSGLVLGRPRPHAAGARRPPAAWCGRAAPGARGAGGLGRVGAVAGKHHGWLVKPWSNVRRQRV